MIKTLALVVRAHDSIKSVQTPGREHKLCLYVDDTLFIVQNPINSIKAIGEVLELFGKASGYKINVSKSVMLVQGITSWMRQQIGLLTEVSWGTWIKHLGVKLTVSLDEAALIDQNLKPLINLT